MSIRANASDCADAPPDQGCAKFTQSRPPAYPVHSLAPRQRMWGRDRDNPGMKWSHTVMVLLLAIALEACSPAFDWREFAPEGSGVIATFPCRPDRQTRNVTIAGTQARMNMLTCSTGGATFALGFVDIADPARMAQALSELRAATVSNLQGTNPKPEALHVAGMTPNAQAVRLSIDGRLPDGAPVQTHASFFAKGLRVYQATVLGPALTPQVTQPFFNGLRFSP